MTVAPTVFMIGLAFNVGLVLLAIALFKNAKFPRWAAVLIGVGALVMVSAALTDKYG